MITVTKETALKMKELGFKKRTEFFFLIDDDTPVYCEAVGDDVFVERFEAFAPTAQEILDEIPDHEKEYIEMQYYPAKENGIEFLEMEAGYFKHHGTPDKNIANALGSLWIKLKEEGIL